MITFARGYVKVVNQRLEKFYRASVSFEKGERHSLRRLETASQAEAYGLRWRARVQRWAKLLEPRCCCLEYAGDDRACQVHRQAKAAA